MDFLAWFFSTDTAQCWLLIATEVFGLLFLMSVLSYITKDSLDGHVDKFIILYLILGLGMLVPTILRLLFTINPALCFGVIQVFVFIIILYGNIYAPVDRYGRPRRNNNQRSILSNLWRRRNIRMRRREALKRAKSFISPYSNILGKIALSNKYCKLIYTPKKDSCKFFCMGKEYNSTNELPFFEAIAIKDRDWSDEFFDSLCMSFSYNTKIENLKKILNKDLFDVDDSNYNVPKPKITKQKNSADTQRVENKKSRPVNEMLKKININEATEAELTALPGVNIVMAKKAIKQRDYKGEYKSVNEFITFLKIKPHFQEQLKDIIVVKPIKKQIVKKSERVVDLD